MSTASAAQRAAKPHKQKAYPPETTQQAGARVYERPPRSAVFPYVPLGEARIANYWTGSEEAEEHQLTLHAWSRQGGHREAHLIAGALLQALDDAALTLDGYHLVNCRFSTADVRRESDGRTYHALVRFRAVTEPA